MRNLVWFALAAILEIAGCFGFWLWLKEGRSPLLALAGVVSLAAFAFCLSQVSAAYAGRAFAAYGGIYIAASLVWFRLVEHGRPDRWDIAGATISVGGALLIMFGRRLS